MSEPGDVRQAVERFDSLVMGAQAWLEPNHHTANTGWELVNELHIALAEARDTLATQPSEAEVERLRTILRASANATGEQLGEWEELPTVIERQRERVESAEAELALMREQVAAYQANEHDCEMKMIRGVAEAQERMTAAEVEVERLRAMEIMGGIAAELVGKIADMVGSRPVFASDLLSQEELLEAVQKLASPSAPSGLELKWAAASEFIRDIIDACALPQPEPNGYVNLPELTLQVIGRIEEGKVLPAPSGWQQRIAAGKLSARVRDYLRNVTDCRHVGHGSVCIACVEAAIDYLGNAAIEPHTCHDMNPPFSGPCRACETEGQNTKDALPPAPEGSLDHSITKEKLACLERSSDAIAGAAITESGPSGGPRSMPLDSTGPPTAAAGGIDTCWRCQRIIEIAADAATSDWNARRVMAWMAAQKRENYNLPAPEGSPTKFKPHDWTHDWVSDSIGTRWCRHCGSNLAQADHPCPRHWPSRIADASPAKETP